MFYLVSKGIYCLILLVCVISHDWALNLKIHPNVIPQFPHDIFFVDMSRANEHTKNFKSSPTHYKLGTLHHCPSLFSLLSPFLDPFLNNFFYVRSKLLVKVVPLTMHMIHVIIPICPCPLQWKKSWASSMHVEAFHLLGTIFVHNTFWLLSITQQFFSITYSVIMFLAIF
jgi:hypothetical protein